MDRSGWRVRPVGPEDLRRLWPLAQICERGARFDAWRNAWAAWLGAAGGKRLAAALSPAAGGVECAGWMAELLPQRPLGRTCLVVRVWLVEPGLPGRVLTAWFGCLRAWARDAGCPRVEVPQAALPPVLREEAETCADRAGLAPAPAGWHAETGLPYRVETGFDRTC